MVGSCPSLGAWDINRAVTLAAAAAVAAGESRPVPWQGTVDLPLGGEFEFWPSVTYLDTREAASHFISVSKAPSIRIYTCVAKFQYVLGVLVRELLPALPRETSRHSFC